MSFIQKQCPQTILTLMQNSHNHGMFIIFQIEDAVVFADKIAIFRMHRNQRIQRTTASGERFQQLNVLFEP